MTSFSLLLNKELVSEPIVIGDSVVLSRKSLYDAHSTSLLVAEFCQQLRLFNRRSLRHTKRQSWVQAMLFSPSNYSDVTLVCGPDGADEIPAHQIILSGSTSAVSGLRQQHSDGRLETEMIDADVINPLLSLVLYTGEIRLTTK
jgi:hypothetical protein